MDENENTPLLRPLASTTMRRTTATESNEGSSRLSSTVTATAETTTQRHDNTNVLSNQAAAAAAASEEEDRDVIDFAPDDPENPRNWPEWRKWLVIVPIIAVDLSVSWGASGYSPAQQKFMADFHVGSEVGVLGLSLYVLGLALGPMSLAPLSEYYGRSLLYVIPYGIFVVFLMGTALVQSLAGFLVLRLLSGLFSGVTIANLGGSIADMWPRHRVGVPVSWWLWAAVGGSPSGFFLMSFVAMARPWRDVFWALMGICGGMWLVMSIVLLWGNETRHSVLLRKRAARLRKERGSSKVDVPDEAKARGIGKLFKVTLSRPFRLLFSEVIVVFAALYNGFLYGLSFLFNGAFGLVFGPTGYGFDTIGVGLAFLGFFCGVCCGPLTYYLYQERYYQRQIHANPPSNRDNKTQITDGYYRNIPEARLQLSKIAAVTLPISLWWFAWTIVPEYHIHWIVPILATALFGWSFYTLILMTYQYIEDSYMVFSASALAGVGLIRNLAGAGFPLFERQMFTNLGYNWAGTILAALSMLLIPIPYILERYGTELRRRSPWARTAMDDYTPEETSSA